MSKFLLWAGIFILSFSSLHAQTFNGTGGAIPDGGAQTCFDITVTGVGTINGTYGLASVCLNITHDWDSDLEIYLRAPDGTIIPLSIQNGVAGVNYTNTCFTSNAPIAITTGTPPYTGNFRPEGNLGAMNNGQNANGTWSLCIQDLFTPDAGTLLNWSLLFNNTPAAPPVIPPNDNPCNAIPLAVGAACSYSNYTNENATATAGVPAPGCSSYLGGDVWFSVTVPAGGGLIFDTQTGFVTDGGMAIYSGTCNALTLIACDDDASSNGFMPMINATGLIPSSTIWIRVWEYGNNNNGTFGICVTLPPPPPPNDDPCNAITLPVNNTCNFTTYTNAGATASTGVPAPGCGNYQGGDVWFTVTVPPGGAILFDSNTGTMTDGDMAIYSGTCNTLTLVRCDDLSSANGLMPSITLYGQTPGATLWVRFWGYGANNTGTFQLCASIPPPPTVQDCPAAIAICQNIYNEPISYTGTGNIPNEINPAISCLVNGERADVWYTFTVTTSGNLNFTLTPNSALDDYDWAVYNLTNATCSNIYTNAALNVSCNYSSTPGPTGPTGASAATSQGAGGTPFNAVIPVTVGQTYVINVSNFSLTNSGYSINFGASTASIFDNVPPQMQSINSAISCGGNLVTVNFSENILCNTIQSADFVILGPGGPYPVTNWSSVTCTAGATYANNLVLTLGSPLTLNGTYQVCLTSAAGSVTDLCGNIASPGCLNFTLSSAVPTFAAIATICTGSTAPVLPTTSLNGFTGTWSPAVVNNTATGTYTFTPDAGQCATTTTLTVTVTIAGDIPTFNAIPAFCSGSAAPVLPTTSTNGITGTWSPATVSNTVSGTYTFTPAAGQCATTATLSVTVNAQTTPTFAAVAPICSGSTAPVLPTTSTNGISGTWSPATVSNTATGTYTFTPGAGQCASTSTLSVTVNAQTTPTFAAIAPICSGSAAPILPTTSTNGITGTWSPATVSNTATGTYTFTPGAGQCATTTTLSVTVNAQTIPTFAAIAPICSGSAAPVLPTTSTNGITGTWSPATVSNTVTGTYTFTPGAGQCASTSTLSVTVNVQTTPTFAAIAPICSGSAAPVLSTTSTNGITGTWSPATVSNTISGTYTFTPNAGQCAATTTLSVTVSSPPVLFTHGTNPSCEGVCDGTATVDVVGGTPPYTYTWSNSGNTQTITGLCAGIYTVTVTDATGCAAPVIPTPVPGCFQVQSIFVDACSPTEYEQEMVFFQVGQNPLNTSAINVSWATAANTWNGLCTDPAFIASVNATITGGGIVLPLPGSGILPANANAVLITSTPATSASSFSNLTDTLYALFQCPGNTQGHFANNSGAPGIRTLVMNFGAGCTDTAKYDPVFLINQNGTTGGSAALNNGAVVNYAGNGTATYLNHGCVIPTTIQSSEVILVAPPATIPVFAPVNAICSGDAAPVLPLTSTNGITGTWSPATVSNTTSGTYTFTPTAGLCATTTTLSITVNAQTTPTFAAIAPICSGSIAPVLPATSTNGINGTWSPATVSNIASGTYTFTPAAGQCATTTTLSVTVNAQITPTFAAIAPICTGSIAPVLTATSTNGINGTWSPATVSNTASGTYAFTPNAGQCATTTTLFVTVIPGVTSTTSISICPNQLPYTWNSQTYNLGGTYSVILVSSTGCDSIATLNLNVGSVVTSTTNISICPAQLPYTWNSQTYNLGGTYSVTLLSSAGCDSIATLNLYVGSTVTSTTNISICPAQLPYTWNSQTYNLGGTYSVTLLSSAGCDSIATLNLAVGSVVTSTTNISICPSQLPYTWNSQTYNLGGTYSVTLVSSAGCDSIATLNLAVGSVVTSTTNISICPSQLPYSWNSQTYNLGGTYSVTLTSSSGCDSIATLNLAVGSVVTSTTSISICPAQLPYSWNSQTYNLGGTYSVTLTSSSGCDSIATLNLAVGSVVTSTTSISICPSQLPYSWNSQTYNLGGTYSVTLVSSAGCDSIATLNLAVGSVVTSTTNISICPSQLPYTWNSQTYNLGGTYSVTLVSSAGCDSIATLNLAVGSVVTSTTNISICPAQLPYTWNSQTYNLGGTYSVTLVSSAGCDSLATLNLFVGSTVTSTTNISICPSQLPYTWNSQTYNLGGTYSVTLVSSAGCDSIATLNLFVGSTVTSTTNISICPSQLPYTWNSQTYNLGGTYSVTLVSSAGCDSIATLNLFVGSTVTSTTNISICPSQLPYTWNSQTYNLGGSYSVTLVSSAGCDSIATLNLFVGSTVTSTTNISICPSQLPYTWNSQTYNLGGTYSVTLVSSAGCDSIATLNLAVGSTVTNTTNISICPSQLPYTWNSQTYNLGGTYSVTLVSSAGCDSIATLNLFVGSTVTSTTNISICPSQLPYTWNSQTYNLGGTYSVTLVSSAGCDSLATLNLFVGSTVASTTNISICPSQLPYTWNSQTYNLGGTYSVTLVSSTGCDSIATLNLAVGSVVTSTTNISICPSQLPYTWNSQTYNLGGTYSVTLVSSAGCDSLATLNLFVGSTVASTTNISICPSQLPYTWNSQTYNLGGTYSVTLVSSAGCDSIATLNLFVGSTVTSTTNISICPSQLPYTWNSQTYNLGGTYSVTLVSSAGCDSLATLNLFVGSTVASTTNISICPSQLPYTWNSQTYNLGGTYSVTLVSSAGCDSIATLNLAVGSVVTSTTNISICPSQLPYTWNSQTYNLGGTYSVTLVSSAGCDSLATLNLFVGSTVASTTNISICPAQLPYTWNSQTYNLGGTYSVTLVSSAGCDSIATLNLAVGSTVTSTTNISICPSQLPYTWNSQTYNLGGTYSVTLTSSGGCDSIATLNLAVGSVVTSTTNISICPGQLPYSWNSQTYNLGGTYSVTLVSSAGCDSIATLNLAVGSVVTSTTNISICPGQLPYSWNSQTYNLGGTYSVTLTSSSGCDSIATLNLFVGSTVTSTTNISICPAQLPYAWNSQTYNLGGTYSVTLTSSSGCDSIATLNLAVGSVVTSTTSISICPSQLPYSWNSQTYNLGGTYSVTLVSSAGCDSIATLNLFVGSTVTSTTNISICPSQLPYTWNSQTYNLGGTYSVTLVSSAGCDSIATLNLNVGSIVTSTTNISICPAQLPYTWNSQTYNLGGTYSVTLVSIAGCDSIATLNLFVGSTVTSTTNISICPAQLPYAWNSQTYNLGGTYSVTLVSSAGCDSIATLNLAVGSVVTSTTNISICPSQLPYTWNSQTYNLGGTYSVTLVSSAGCDSIATLNLNVGSVVTSTTNISICPAQLPYTWNSQTYNLGGTYSVTLVSIAGCDSIATLNLNVGSVVTSTTNISICPAQLPYTWNSQTYNLGGTYSVTLVSIVGCDSIATLNLFVGSTVTSTTNISICPAQLPYAWNSQTYNLGGTYSVTLVSSAGCDSIATLNLNVGSTVTSTTNISICPSQLPYTWNSQTYNLGGTYSVTLISSAGCDSIATLNLNVGSTVTSTTNISICPSQLPYSWNSQTYNLGGTYSVTLLSSAGCDSIATLNLNVGSTVTSTTNISICPAQLPYTWNSQTYNLGGTYSVTLISSAGCDSIATLFLNVKSTSTSTTNVTVCSNQLPYFWNGQSYTTAGPHLVTLVNSVGCDSTASLNLIINNTSLSTTNVTVCSNQLPYLWNGQSYTTAGPHSVIFVNSVGCDSTATLNLTINNISSSTTNVTVCSNQLPYLWNGQSYTTPGPHVVTLVNSAGCDSTATLNLNINNTSSSTTNVTVCSNQLPYLWNGQSYTTPGPHVVTLVNSAGCDSTATLNLNINNTSSSTTNVTVCSNQLPYLWNGQSYTTAGPHSVIFVNSVGCDSTATLNLTINNISSSTTNVTVCSNLLPYLWNGQSYTTAGPHSVIFVNSVGCDSTATLNLTINNTSSSTTNASVCDNHLPFVWNGQSYTTAGPHVVTLVNTVGCDSTATLNLTINPVVSSTTNASTCSNQLPYIWNGQSFSTAGPHTVILTSSLGCDSLAKLNLTINQSPAAPAVISPVNYCQFSASVALTAGASNQLLWYTVPTGGTASTTTPVPSTQVAGTFYYYVSQTTGLCESQRSLITVKVNAKPVLGPDKSIRICYAAYADLRTLYNTNGLTFTWTYNQLPVNPAAVNLPGIYQLVVAGSSGCTDTALVTLSMQPPVVANAGPDGNAEPNIPYQLHGTGGVQYLWSPAGALNDPQSANPRATITDDTQFILMVTDEIGCRDIDTVNLRILNGPTFYVPTAFTPNGDGSNDLFRPTAVGIASMEYFRVFNRYGELIYETSEITKGWNGMYKGKEQPIGTYVWNVKGIDRKGQVKTMKGFVVLIR